MPIILFDVLCMLLGGIAVNACTPMPVVFTVSTGSHALLTDEDWIRRQEDLLAGPVNTFLVWSQHPGASNAAVEDY